MMQRMVVKAKIRTSPTGCSFLFDMVMHGAG
jgi:hypothetical protein